MSSKPTTAQPVTDALEQRDPWRTAWLVTTHDVLVIALAVIIAAALIAGYVLPQMPTGGTSEPLAYSQWQTQARTMAGPFFDIASVLSLFSVAQAFWLRIIIAALIVILGLRLVDRVSRLASSLPLFHSAPLRGDILRDEERMRVMDNAPALTDIAMRARQWRYHVALSQTTSPSESINTLSWLVIDHAPLSEVFSIGLHLGMLIILAGVVLNSSQGWDVTRQQVDTDSPATLQRGNIGLQLTSVDDVTQNAVLTVQGAPLPASLTVGARAALVWTSQLQAPCCFSLRLNELIPGYHVSAIDHDGKPMTITVSSYAEPVRDVLLTIRRDEPGRLVALESARMAVLVSEDHGGRVQVYGVPQGNVMTDTAISASMVISNTTLKFRPTMSVVVAAQYRPGDMLIWFGGVLAALGLLAVTLWPMQRLVVRHHGYWTEFYAYGRGARKLVRALLNQEVAQSNDH